MTVQHLHCVPGIKSKQHKDTPPRARCNKLTGKVTPQCPISLSQNAVPSVTACRAANAAHQARSHAAVHLHSHILYELCDTQDSHQTSCSMTTSYTPCRYPAAVATGSSVRAVNELCIRSNRLCRNRAGFAQVGLETAHKLNPLGQQRLLIRGVLAHIGGHAAQPELAHAELISHLVHACSEYERVSSRPADQGCWLLRANICMLLLWCRRV